MIINQANTSNTTFSGKVHIMTYKDGKLVLDKYYKTSKINDVHLIKATLEKFNDRKLYRFMKNETTDNIHNLIEKYTKTKVENLDGEKFLYLDKVLKVILFGDYDKLKIIPKNNGTEFIIDLLV